MPKVSVILTSFNHEKYIREAIESVLNQTFSDFELIIWDDASTDNSWSIIQEYKDPRIKAFRNETSRRAIYGVNRSIEEIAKGEFIAMQHSDDVWDVQKLAKQVAYLDGHPDTVAVFSWAQIIDGSGADVPIQWFNQEPMSRWQWLRQLFAGENHLNHPSVLIRRSCYGDVGVFKYGLAQAGDAELWSRVLLRSDIFVIPEKLTKHRIFSDGSNTSGPGLVKSIRTENEWNIIRMNYFGLTSEEEICQIFPALKRFHSPSGCIPRFLLAMACLYECNSRAAWALGLRTLYELIISPDTAAQLSDIYHFNYRSLIDLSGQFDPYAFGASDAHARDMAEIRAEVRKRDEAISDVGQAIHGRDEQFANLQHAFDERGGLIERLQAAAVDAENRIAQVNQSMAERDVRILDLLRLVDEREAQVSQSFMAVTERDRQIAVLAQTVTDRDGHIGDLNRVIRERDAELAKWRQAVDDQGGLIKRLNQVIGERDAELARWRQAVDDQGGLIERLNRAVAERDAQIAALLNSTSWRMTKGFRWIRRKAGKAAQLLRSITIGRILRYGFRKLPLSMTAKDSIKGAVFKRFGFLLRNQPSYRHWHQLNRLEKESATINGGSLAVSRISLDLPPGLKKILVIDATTPTPDRDAGSVTAWFFLKAMVELGYDVTFIPADLKPLGRYTENLRALGVRALTSNDIETIEQFLEQKGQEIDIAFLYRVHTARLSLPLIKKHAPKARIIFDTVDLHYLREERQAELSGDPESIKAARYTKQAEYEMMRSADATIVLSQAEQEIIKREDPGINLSVIPLLLDIPGCKKPFSRRSDIVFIGGFLHQPNIDAIKYFVSDIWPTVRSKLPEANLLVIGSNAPEEILALGANDKRIKVVGFVEDIDPYFNQCRLSIAPLRYGAGIKGKIGTSASYGVPCVATTLAAEGMGLVDGVEVMVADGAAQFAEKVIDLYSDENLWVSVSKGSLDFVRRNYSYETGKARLDALVRSLFI